MKALGLVAVVVAAAAAVAVVAILVKPRVRPLKAGEREEPIRENLPQVQSQYLSSFVPSSPKGGARPDPIPWWEGGEGG